MICMPKQNKNGIEKGNNGIDIIENITQKSNKQGICIQIINILIPPNNRITNKAKTQVPITGQIVEISEIIPHKMKKTAPATIHIAQSNKCIIAKIIIQTIKSIKLIIPSTIHPPHTKNPTHGIKAQHRANPRRHPKPNMTIGIVSRGTMMMMRQSKMSLRIRWMTFVIMKMQMAKRRAHETSWQHRKQGSSQRRSHNAIKTAEIIAKTTIIIKSNTRPQIGNNIREMGNIVTVIIIPTIRATIADMNTNSEGNAPAINITKIINSQ
ncbi:MAG: hypothetical protein MASP_00531 [Candidatus Methanolliviera sp. GoM_asphalt]|nr:MAG: hypothetical protein MASP_00531 [Candidatus Methanolliviera sp. GoM_asphalt]